jgi:hypothetical protein
VPAPFESIESELLVLLSDVGVAALMCTSCLPKENDEEGVSKGHLRESFQLYMVSLLQQLAQSTHCPGLSKLIDAVKAGTSSEEAWSATTWLLTQLSCQAVDAPRVSQDVLADGLATFSNMLEASSSMPTASVDDCYYTTLQRMQLMLPQTKAGQQVPVKSALVLISRERADTPPLAHDSFVPALVRMPEEATAGEAMLQELLVETEDESDSTDSEGGMGSQAGSDLEESNGFLADENGITSVPASDSSVSGSSDSEDYFSADEVQPEPIAVMVGGRSASGDSVATVHAEGMCLKLFVLCFANSSRRRQRGDLQSTPDGMGTEDSDRSRPPDP